MGRTEMMLSSAGAPEHQSSEHQLNRAFTLIELLIAISLVGLIILAIVAVDVGSRGFLKTSDDESILQNEASFIMESIVRDIGKNFKGTLRNPSVKVSSGNTIEIRQRVSADSFDLSNSRWMRYQFADSTVKKQTCDSDSSGLITSSCSPSPAQQIARNVISGCVFSFDDNTGVAGLSLTARARPSEDPGQDNPEVVLETSVSSRSATQ